MNFPETLKPLILATLLTQLGYAGPLDAYRGVNRLIVVSMPQASSAEKVAAALVAHSGKIEDRELEIIDVSDGAQRIQAALRLSPEQTHSLRKQLKLDSGNKQPVYILIGKDGGEKARQTGTLDLDKWFVLIDGMPMRRREIQNLRKENQ